MLSVALFGVLLSMPRSVSAQNGVTGVASVIDTMPNAYQHHTPAACFEAVERIKQFRGRARLDTARLDVTKVGDVDSVVAAVARACVASFSTAKVDPRDLPSLVKLHGLLRNDAEANIAADRWIESQSREQYVARAYALATLVRGFLAIQRPDRARAYALHLDSLDSPEARVLRVEAHQSLANAAESVLNGTLAIAEAETAIAIARRATGANETWSPRTFSEQRIAGGAGQMYVLIAQITFSQGGDPSPALATLARAGREFGPSAAEMLKGVVHMFELVGQRAPRINAQYWLGARQDTMYPSAGKISLLSFGTSRRTTPILRRLSHVVPGVSVVHLKSTRGHFQGDGMFEPAAEADTLGRYFFDELKVPGILGVSVSPLTIIPDGRRRWQPTTTEGDYRYASAVVVDAQGIVRGVFGSIFPSDELRMEHMLRRVHLPFTPGAPKIP